MSATRKKLLEENGLSYQSYAEEFANTFIHFVGLALSIAGLYLLLSITMERGTNWHVLSSAVFGGSLVLLYMTSCLYHGVPWITAKKLFRRLDHISVYFLIAGSYTPLALIFLRPTVGWLLFGLVWGLAFTGATWKAVVGHKYDSIVDFGYLAMGWVLVIAYHPMLNDFPREGLYLLLTGGFFYSFGIIFYFNDQKVKYFHAVWHLFVLAGSVCHYLTILWYVIPISM